MPQEQWVDLGVSEVVIQVLQKAGLLEPFKIQSLVIGDALTGADLLAKSRTGSGKTLAFAIPIVETIKPNARIRPCALVLVPTRELASQVAEDFTPIARAKGLRVAAVYGGVGINLQARAASHAHVVIATPGRLEDLVARRLLKLDGVGTLILDEADRMLDMGFQPQVDRIVAKLPSKRQTMFFSATLDGEVGRLARAYTNDAKLYEVESKMETVEEVEHRFVPVTMSSKLGELVGLLGSEQGTALVFVRTKRGADNLVRQLNTQKRSAVAMHGDLSQSQRERALAQFESGKIRTLVATDVAARGLDLESISHVINFDPPSDAKGYIHRLGRTARAGKSGVGITFVLPDQAEEVSRIATRLKLHVEFEKGGLHIAPPRSIHTSRRGRNSMLGRRPRRRVG